MFLKYLSALKRILCKIPNEIHDRTKFLQTIKLVTKLVCTVHFMEFAILIPDAKSLGVKGIPIKL
jgi:hypothetical protein